MSTVTIIGSGFSSLAAASVLAQKGHRVKVLEKNATPGGRARQFQEAGFTFDMGPSWYWMPDVMERFFERFDQHTSNYFDLKRLDPSYRIFFEDGDRVDVPAGEAELYELFESMEEGSGKKLKRFLEQAAIKYQVGVNHLVYQPALSPLEFVNKQVLSGMIHMDLFQSVGSSIRKQFKNDKLIKLLEFPSLFLGATPGNTPALYSLMNYADLKLGTWYPMGGMYRLVDAMYQLALEQGVEFHFNTPVTEISVHRNRATGLQSGEQFFPGDQIIAGADYEFVENQLLSPDLRSYSNPYWKKRTMAPSALIFYLGVKGSISNLKHHNLFFDRSFDQHADEIYTHPKWPEQPLFYACVPSKTDDGIAPSNHENVFILMPLAPGLNDHESIREKYFDLLMTRLEGHTGEKLTDRIVYKRSYCINDFKKDYNSFRGNAYGLANTLRQTAFLKPKLKSKKVQNLYYTGQLTSPGPGVPPAIISGQVAADLLSKHSNP
ncbi:phytoene desaturase [bacterium SCSIO 12741]|nr:phytoene desaturase [bacterium SCSIO 12741]